MDKLPHVKTARQARAVKALLDCEAIPVKDLGPLIGALNPRQIIFELRKQGFIEIIQTRHFEVFDRDGQRCWPGEYYIPCEQKLFAQEALKNYATSLSIRKMALSRKKNLMVVEEGK